MNDRIPDTARQEQLVAAFLALADTLVDHYDVIEILDRLVGYCVRLLDVDAAGLMLADQRGGLQVMASSSAATHLLELFQLQADQGPCLDAYHSGAAVVMDDLHAPSATDRWPSFTPQAVQHGFGAVHAVPLRLRRESIGALNLFTDHPGPLPGNDLQIAQALANTATVGILHERAVQRGEVLTEQLQAALTSHATVEQAHGMLAYAGHLHIEQAVTVLREYARVRGVGVSTLAGRLATGRLDPREVVETVHVAGAGSS